MRMQIDLRAVSISVFQEHSVDQSLLVHIFHDSYQLIMVFNYFNWNRDQICAGCEVLVPWVSPALTISMVQSTIILATMKKSH